jgi:hypothetical protein
MGNTLTRVALSATERNFRSRIAQLASSQWVLRGTLSERSGKCGKPTCHCGKPRQLCVPQAWQARIRQAVEDYQQMQRLIEEISELEWKRLKERKR